jgi:hypothetical protein
MLNLYATELAIVALNHIESLVDDLVYDLIYGIEERTITQQDINNAGGYLEYKRTPDSF